MTLGINRLQRNSCDTQTSILQEASREMIEEGP